MLSSPAGGQAAATLVELATRELVVEQHAETADAKTDTAKVVQHARAVSAIVACVRVVLVRVVRVRVELVLMVDVRMVESVVSQCRSIPSIETFTRTMLLRA